MATKKKIYTEAFAQLNDILDKIENGELDVDDLTANVKKAAELIKTCKSKLYETEAEVEKILDELEEAED
jgi:exodeoxyribonuclease VII small subunit